MNLKELARATAGLKRLSIADTEAVIGAAFKEIGKAMQNGEKVTIHEFGIFDPIHKPATTARNPATGAQVEVPAKIAIKFKTAKALKDQLVGE